VTQEIIKKAIDALRSEFDQTSQRDHVQGLLDAALQGAEWLEGNKK
jgi:hypothetical protein